MCDKNQAKIFKKVLVNFNRKVGFGLMLFVVQVYVKRELRLEKAFVLSLFGFYSAAQNLIGDFDHDGGEQLHIAIERAKSKS